MCSIPPLVRRVYWLDWLNNCSSRGLVTGQVEVVYLLGISPVPKSNGSHRPCVLHYFVGGIRQSRPRKTGRDLALLGDKSIILPGRVGRESGIGRGISSAFALRESRAALARRHDCGCERKRWKWSKGLIIISLEW